MTIPINSGVSFRGSGRKIKQILDYYPGSHSGLYITSSYRGYSTGSHHSTGNAVDVASAYPSNPGPMKDVARWLYQFSSDLTELIHTNGNYFVKNGRKVGAYYYGSATRGAHWNHVHVAMTSAQADRILRKLRNSGAAPGSGVPAGTVRKVIDIQKGHNYLRYLLGQSYRLVEDGIWGPKTAGNVKWLQRNVGVKDDGVWGPATEAAYMKKVDQLKGSSSKKKSPSKENLTVDGKLGPNTIRAMQRALGVKDDGVLGPVTVKALQRKVGATVDGNWGPQTTRKLQEYLNRI